MSSLPRSFLSCLLFAARESTDKYFMTYVVSAFLALVAAFVLYQKWQSGWTWREFGEGMFSLMTKALILGTTALLGHPYIPTDRDK